MKQYGLIGLPLTHSFSQNYFSEKFRHLNLPDHRYSNFPLSSIEELLPLIQAEKNLCGLNVTIPYKEKVMPLLNEMSEEAKSIGAVNTISISRNNNTIHLKGYNTDYYGFAQSVKPFLLNTHHRALILGTGGASKAVEYFCRQTGIDFLKISREKGRGNLTYTELNEYILKNYLFIINTTPLGMSPGTENYPDIPYECISSGHLMVDLIYNPAETLFLEKAKKRGAVTLNGMAMLKLQAEASWKIWNEENR
ncbi:MAG: shikimate dehydrogenase family protein [Bacteroidota bacterium]